MSERNKDNIILEYFCKFLFENKFVDELLSIEAGATKEEIFRDTDHIIEKKNNNNKSFSEISDNIVTIQALVYLPGRMVWWGHLINGGELSKLFTIEEMQQINESNAIEMFTTKTDELLLQPHTFLRGYDPIVIYYRRIKEVRLYDWTGKTVKEKTVLRVNFKDTGINDSSGHHFPIQIFQEDAVKDCRWDFLDIEDIRFLNAQIAEQELKNS
ncbi:hypothetical protein OAV49_01075 [Alphaproteobacteria bacterium]|nr:hypothetical protein [Alphaproteobacteria bacterium]